MRQFVTPSAETNIKMDVDAPGNDDNKDNTMDVDPPGNDDKENYMNVDATGHSSSSYSGSEDDSVIIDKPRVNPDKLELDEDEEMVDQEERTSVEKHIRGMRVLVCCFAGCFQFKHRGFWKQNGSCFRASSNPPGD